MNAGGLLLMCRQISRFFSKKGFKCIRFTEESKSYINIVDQDNQPDSKGYYPLRPNNFTVYFCRSVSANPNFGSRYSQWAWKVINSTNKEGVLVINKSCFGVLQCPNGCNLKNIALANTKKTGRKSPRGMNQIMISNTT